jgi:hypothetical protein
MASQIIQTTLKSLSTQVHSALATVDVDHDGVISAGEAASFAPSLRDNFDSYQARHSGPVKADSFARSFMANAAIALRAADKNHDGVLSATEQKTLPASLADNVHAAGSHSGSSVFLGRGSGTPAVLAGQQVTQLPISTTKSALAQKLTMSPDCPFFAAAFKADPKTLQGVLADPAKQKAFLNDTLFRASGSDYETKYPDYYTPAQLTVTAPTDAAKGADFLLDKMDQLGTFQDSQHSKTEVSADLQQMTGALFAGGATKSFELTWSNDDDAQFHAVVAVNEATGQVRVAGFYPVP